LYHRGEEVHHAADHEEDNDHEEEVEDVHVHVVVVEDEDIDNAGVHVGEDAAHAEDAVAVVVAAL